MKTKHIEIKADIGDKVYIVALECFARIITLWIDRSGVQYQIGYFHNGERKTAYIFQEEFEIR